MTTVLECNLELHDTLYFASREIGRLYETERLIHNYALCYALGLASSPYFIAQQTPAYRQDLTGLNQRGIYVTPALDVSIGFSMSTWKYGDNHYHVKMEKPQTNTPTYGRAKEIAPESRFRFFIVSEEPDYRPPRWIRLGKWLSKARIEHASRQASQPKNGEYVVNHPLNPLDVLQSNSVTLCDLLNMPPVSLIHNAHLSGEYIALDDLCLPARMTFNFPEKRKK